MIHISRVEDLLRAYEDEVLVPMVRDAGILRPVRDRLDFSMEPGTFAFLINNAANYVFHDGVVRWDPLSVIYTDKNRTTGTVFAMTADFDLKTETVRFQRAEITNIVILIRTPREVIWVDPHSKRVFQVFPLEESDKILLNSWFLFKGAILPMLMTVSYRFVPPEEQFAFQRTMIRHINRLYEGQVA